MRIIAKRPHIAKCFMVHPGPHGSPWCLDIVKARIHADKNGNNTGGTQSWIRLRCNDPKCTALVLVHEWDLMEFVHEALS